MSARHTHLREAARLRLLAANTTTLAIKTRLLAEAVEHEKRAEAALPRGSMNSLRRLAAWHRSHAHDFQEDERQRRLKLAQQIEWRADELERDLKPDGPTRQRG